MGAWGHGLLSNDHVQDEVYTLNETSAEDLPTYLSRLQENAQKESLKYKVNEDDLPLIYEPEEKEVLLSELVDAEQETYEREIYLGILCHLLDSPVDNPILKSHKLVAQEMVKELCHQKLLRRWRNPKERFNELFNFEETLNKI